MGIDHKNIKERGSNDLIWSGYALTEKRKNQVFYTNLYLKNIPIITRLDSDIQSIDDLGEKAFMVVCRQIDSKLCSGINQTLTKMNSDRTFEQIYQTWFSN